MGDEPSRYHRQLLLPGFGEAGQRRLHESTALVLGCGALGGIAADMLVRAGVGHVVVADRDLVELTNLQRQVLFDERDVGMPKAVAAKARLERVNSRVEVTALVDDVDDTNIESHAAGADVLVDGLDNFETRYLANDYAVKHGVPYVYGGAVGTSGMAYAILPHAAGAAAPWAPYATPCLRCLFDEMPSPGSLPTCDTAGILGPAAALVASFEAAEALKVLTRSYDRACSKLLEVDLWAGTFRQLDVSAAYRAAECACCGRRRFEFLDGAHASGATVLCGADAVQVRPSRSAGFELDAVAERLRRHGRVAATAHMLRAGLTDNGVAYELTVFRDGRAIVKGTHDAAVARGLYAKYIGI